MGGYWNDLFLGSPLEGSSLYAKPSTNVTRQHPTVLPIFLTLN
jgi:hypothetical protein